VEEKKRQRPINDVGAHVNFGGGMRILGRRTNNEYGVQYITLDLGVFDETKKNSLVEDDLVKNRDEFRSIVSQYGQKDLGGYRSGKPCSKQNDDTNDDIRDNLVNSNAILVI